MSSRSVAAAVLQRVAQQTLYMDVIVSEVQSLTDREVVERVLAGEKALYELLMRRHNQRLYRVARSVVREDSEAEDVLQDAWARAYEHLAQFEGRSSFATWVTRIAYYEALARAKKQKRWAAVEDEDGDVLPQVNRQAAVETPEEQAMRDELGRMLEAAVDGLPDGYRTVFVLREVEQLSTSETAEALGASEEAVKTRLHRARALLRRELAARIGSAASETFAFMGARCDRTVARVMARIE